jgi:hypothetical protein
MNVIFENTPMADYLQQADNPGMADWGLDDEYDFDSSDEDLLQSYEGRRSYEKDPNVEENLRRIDEEDEYDTDTNTENVSSPEQQPSQHPQSHPQNTQRKHRRFASTSAIQPLHSANENLMKRERFQLLLAGALRQSLPLVENNRFLEKFRYIVVTSQLLSEQPPVSSKTPNFPDDKDLLPETTWATSGGCVVVVVGLFSWAVRKKAIFEGKARAMASLVATLCLVIFMYAHSRRRLLRIIRIKAVQSARQFVLSSQGFDAAVHKSLGVIHEVEFLSKGFSFPQKTVEGTDLDVRLCKQLRAALSASLYLSISSLTRSIRKMLNHCHKLDLEKYLDIYEVDVMDLSLFVEDDGPIPEHDFTASSPVEALRNMVDVPEADFYGSKGANHSHKNLKFYHYKFHLLRRVMLCCLLSMTASGTDGSEYTQWKLVSGELSRSEKLLRQLDESLVDTIYGLDHDAKLLSHSRSDSLFGKVIDSRKGRRLSSFNLLSEPSSAASEPSKEVQQHLKQLSRLSSTLRQIEGRMQIAREGSMSHIESASADELLTNYRTLGDDIQSLASIWQGGMSSLEAKLKNPSTSRAEKTLSFIEKQRHLSDATVDTLASPLLQQLASLGSPVHNNDSSTVSQATTLAEFEDDVHGPAAKQSALSNTYRALCGDSTPVSSPPMSPTMLEDENGIPIQYSQFGKRRSFHQRDMSLTTILEGIANKDKGKGLGIDTSGTVHEQREKRIARMKEEREREVDNRAAANRRGSVMLELKTVLENR